MVIVFQSYPMARHLVPIQDQSPSEVLSHGLVLVWCLHPMEVKRVS